MSDVDDLLSKLPYEQIAAQLGISPDQARAASAQALPALFGGLAANVEDEGAAASLGEALGQHSPLSDSVDLEQVDAADGEKIVGHVFGDNADAVVNQLAGASTAAGLDSDLTKKLLSILAPLVLSFIAGKVAGKGGAAAGGIGAPILQEILKGALSGSGANKKASGGGIGDILGDVLGGLLGGGRR